MKSKIVRNLCLFLGLLLTLSMLFACAGEKNPVSSPTVEVSGETVTATPAQSTQKPTARPSDDSYEDQRKQAQIGIWYAIWYDSTADGSFWDTSGRKNATYPGDPIYYRPLLPDGTYGKYSSLNNEIINFHLKEIADAQIDFIILDQTNDIDNGMLNSASLKTAKLIQAWNKVEGNRTIKYCSAIGAFATKDNMGHIESEAKKLYERYINVKHGWGSPENHVYVDGKPLMVIFNCVFTEEEWNEYQATHDTPYCDRFTIRYSTGHVKEGEKGMWGWCMQDGPQIDEDVAVMMPGWYKIAREGEPYGKPWHPYVYRQRGKFYADSWKELLQSNIVPDFVVINSFNEYAEHTGVFTAKTDLFPANYGIERWLDADGKENPSMYWDMTKEYISKFKNGDRG